jgi:hypothetical protein
MVVIWMMLFSESRTFFQCVKLKLKNLNSFIYNLCSYVLKLNKWKHLLFMTFLKSPDSLTHPVCVCVCMYMYMYIYIYIYISNQIRTSDRSLKTITQPKIINTYLILLWRKSRNFSYFYFYVYTFKSVLVSYRIVMKFATRVKLIWAVVRFQGKQQFFSVQAYLNSHVS